MIEIKELQELISKQKQLAGLNFYGAFRDGYLAAWDILNTYLKAKEPKAMDACNVCSGDFLVEDIFTCDRCGKLACPDCLIGQKLAEDDFESVCKNCLKGKE